MSWTNTGWGTFNVQFFTPECCKCGAKQGTFATIANRFICNQCLIQWVTQNKVFEKHWIEEAFLSINPIQRPGLFKSLAKVLHPDQGGSDTIMQKLNEIYEKYR